MGHDRIVFPLDVSTMDEAASLMGDMQGLVGVMKVGLEFFIGSGPLAVAACHRYSYDVFLDLKLHDIPETVERATARAVDLGVKFMSVHVQQPSTIERVLKKTEGTKTTPLFVTVLTSMLQTDLEWLDYKMIIPAARVESVAYKCYTLGARGFVCSPQEVAVIRKSCPESKLVVPGIRPAGAATGDQKRIGTPLQAIRDGADYLVVGRPIRDAKDRKAAATAIAEEISEGLAG